MSSEVETSRDETVKLTLRDSSTSLDMTTAQTGVINTALQRGDREFRQIPTASAVFILHRKTAKAVCTRMVVLKHLAEARF